MKLILFLGIFVILSLCSGNEQALKSILAGERWESGYVQVGKERDQLFYFLLRAVKIDDTTPFIIWLNGGPGCSSMYGLFEENGPFTIDRKTLSFKKNQYAWNSFADMLYVDQPVGVGFSTASDVNSLCENEVCVARVFYTFLVKFLDSHPDIKGRPIYLAGESYAGHYIPAIGRYIVKANNENIKLQGVALGNPFISMPVQVQAYPFFLYEEELVSFVEYVSAKVMNLICYAAETLKMPPIYILATCAISFGGIKTIANPYDIRENETYDKMDGFVEDMLKLDDVQRLFGVNVPNFVLCNMTILKQFYYDIPVSYSNDVEFLLNKNIDTMLFFGNKDYVCNWRGGEALVETLNWQHKEGFAKEETRFWFAEGVRSGTYRKYKNLNFLTVFDAGHMVPLNQPISALVMIKRFISQQFDTK